MKAVTIRTRWSSEVPTISSEIDARFAPLRRTRTSRDELSGSKSFRPDVHRGGVLARWTGNAPVLTKIAALPQRDGRMVKKVMRPPCGSTSRDRPVAPCSVLCHHRNPPVVQLLEKAEHFPAAEQRVGSGD